MIKYYYAYYYTFIIQPCASYYYYYYYNVPIGTGGKRAGGGVRPSRRGNDAVPGRRRRRGPAYFFPRRSAVSADGDGAASESPGLWSRVALYDATAFSKMYAYAYRGRRLGSRDSVRAVASLNVVRALIFDGIRVVAVRLVRSRIYQVRQ